MFLGAISAANSSLVLYIDGSIDTKNAMKELNLPTINIKTHVLLTGGACLLKWIFAIRWHRREAQKYCMYPRESDQLPEVTFILFSPFVPSNSHSKHLPEANTLITTRVHFYVSLYGVQYLTLNYVWHTGIVLLGYGPA